MKQRMVPSLVLRPKLTHADPSARFVEINFRADVMRRNLSRKTCGHSRGGGFNACR